MKLEIIFLQTVDSTNEYAKRIYKTTNLPKLIIAEEQTKGKGQRGKKFYSPRNTGVYFSLLIQPTIKIEDISIITLLSAVGIIEVLMQMANIKANIKKVNDIFINRKKVGGILCESKLNNNNNISYLIIGIGLNFTTKNFPKELESIAASLFDDSQTINKNDLIFAITEKILSFLEEFNKDEIIRKYNEYVTIAL